MSLRPNGNLFRLPVNWNMRQSESMVGSRSIEIYLKRERVPEHLPDTRYKLNVAQPNLAWLNLTDDVEMLKHLPFLGLDLDQTFLQCLWVTAHPIDLWDPQVTFYRPSKCHLKARRNSQDIPVGLALNYLGRANNKPPFQLAMDAILYLEPEYI